MTTWYPVWTVWPPDLLVMMPSLSISMLEKIRDEWQTWTVTSQTSLSSSTSQNEEERETYTMVKEGAAECNTNGTISILQRHSFIPVYAAFLVTSPAQSKASCKRSKGQLSDHWARKSAGMAQHQAQSSSLFLSWICSNISNSSVLSLLPPPSSFLPRDRNYH